MSLLPGHPRYFMRGVPRQKSKFGGLPSLGQIKQAAAIRLLSKIAGGKPIGISLKNTGAKANARMSIKPGVDEDTSGPASINTLLKRMS